MKRLGMKLGLFVVALAVLTAVAIHAMRRAPSAPVSGDSGEPPTEAKVPSPSRMPQEPLKPIVQERMEDPVYVAELKALTESRRVKAQEAAEVRKAVRALMAAASAALVEEGNEPTEETVRERAMQNPEWPALEAKATAIQEEQFDIDRQVTDHIRGRMSEQYAVRRRHLAARIADGSVAAHARPAPEIRRMTNDMAWLDNRVVITNRGDVAARRLPVSPERTPVVLPGRKAKLTP